MEIVKANSTDASFEKHIPTYTICEDEICVKVNHVMEKDHYIQYIILIDNEITYIEKLYSEIDAIVRFKYIKGSTLYSYCNKHGLWKLEKVK